MILNGRKETSLFNWLVTCQLIDVLLSVLPYHTIPYHTISQNFYYNYTIAATTTSCRKSINQNCFIALSRNMYSMHKTHNKFRATVRLDIILGTKTGHAYLISWIKQRIFFFSNSKYTFKPTYDNYKIGKCVPTWGR